MGFDGILTSVFSPLHTSPDIHLQKTHKPNTLEIRPSHTHTHTRWGEGRGRGFLFWRCTQGCSGITDALTVCQQPHPGDEPTNPQ